ncbi:MAG: GNAT family N-acetyltransferase [Oscillospiraceae bacterium]|jgi:hypothetical protein|nr:GNAT family N-acetyltransferase [Oscillospiraceae bacterium]
MTVPDVNFLPEYCRAFEKCMNGEYTVFRHKDNFGETECGFIKRGLEEFGMPGYYDIVTTYGYGGDRIIRLSDESAKSELISEHKKEFEIYCKDNRIVTYFARFNPFEGNAADFAECFDSVELSRKIVAINLRRDLLYEEFTKAVRRKQRAAVKSGVEVELDYSCDTIDDFIEMYYATMRKRNASEFYFFGREFFSDLTRNLKGKAMLVNARKDGKIVAGELLLYYGETAYTFLCASREGYPVKYEVYLTSAEQSLTMQSLGYKRLVLGGGMSGDTDDSLLQFKRHFSTSPLEDFYIGRKVYDANAYKSLCGKRNATDNGFFPSYRSKN